MVRGLKIELWIVVIWRKPLWSYLWTHRQFFMWTFPNSCWSSAARFPPEHQSFPIFLYAITHAKTSGPRVSGGPTLLSSMNSRKMRKLNSLENAAASLPPVCMSLQLSAQLGRGNGCMKWQNGTETPLPLHTQEILQAFTSYNAWAPFFKHRLS